MADDDFETRFGGIARLYGQTGLAALRLARVAVLGMGGVGSWIVESLARSGVGGLLLVDLDDICVSNVNRQLHALQGTYGRSKVDVMAERARLISPECRVETRSAFFTQSTAEEILSPPLDYVVDAIDHVGNKSLLIARCRDLRIPLVVCGAAGGRRDPTLIRVVDLALSTHDRLLAQVRSQLRKDYGFPSDKRPFGVDCVFTSEPPLFPLSDGSVCSTRPASAGNEDTKLNCDSGLGSAAFVTGAFGLVAASVVVRQIATKPAACSQ